MPVRVFPSAQRAEVTRWTHDTADAKGILQSTNKRLEGQKFQLYRSSLDDLDPQVRLRSMSNGFVDSVITAYGQHHHLVIRPDDVWMAVLSQFSFYVNAHAEELRRHFVDFEGQEELRIDVGEDEGDDDGGKDVARSNGIKDRWSLDYGRIAVAFTGLIQRRVVDPELRKWMMPCFSTTTQHDCVVAGMMMMGTLQNYFNYSVACICGIPSVTLLGERADYERLTAKIERLARYGPEAEQFARLLWPVARRMALTFDEPAAPDTVDFWSRIAHHRGGGGCVPTGRYSGWITAFCFWSKEGKCMYGLEEGAVYDAHGGSAGIRGFFSAARSRDGGKQEDNIYLELDGARYHHIGDRAVPPAWCALPLKICEASGETVEAEILAGLSAAALTSSEDVDDAGRIGLDTLQPQPAWWVYEKTEYKDPLHDPERMWHVTGGDSHGMQRMGFRRKEDAPRNDRLQPEHWEWAGEDRGDAGDGGRAHRRMPLF